MSSVCKNCGSTDIDRDQTRGNAVCTQCGVVVEDQIIVSEIQFQENATGGASVIGQFVSFESRHNSAGGSRNYGRDSRHVTLQNGKNRIQKLASNLNLSSHCADMAYNFFKLAVSKSLTKGRRSIHVAAACLYIACRTEKKPLMLLDFSDKLGTDVYTLGHTYLQLSKDLYIAIPAIVCNIESMLSSCNLPEKTLEVAGLLTRLVGRMSRDWMVQGRRPSGICGAALLVAARIFDFNRTIKDMMKVVRIGEQTIKKRLLEFEKTPSSKLTVEEFHTINLEETMDPPCFTEGKKKAKLLELEENGVLPELLEEAEELRIQLDAAIQEMISRKNIKYRKFKNSFHKGAEDDVDVAYDDDDSKAVDWCTDAPSTNELDEELAHYQNLLGDDTATPATTTTTAATTATNESFDIVDQDIDSLMAAELDQILGNNYSSNINDSSSSYNNVETNDARNNLQYHTSLGLKESIDECLQRSKKDDDNDEGGADSKNNIELENNGELDLTGLDDDELDEMILNSDEVRIKTAIWMRENADFLKEMKEKEERKAKELLENPEPLKKRRKSRKCKSKVQALTAKEAIEKIVHEKKLSNKINYDVLMDFNLCKMERKPNVNAMDAGRGDDGVRLQSENVIVLDNDDADCACKAKKLKLEETKKVDEAPAKKDGGSDLPVQEFKSNNISDGEMDNDEFFFDNEIEHATSEQQNACKPLWFTMWRTMMTTTTPINSTLSITPSLFLSFYLYSLLFHSTLLSLKFPCVHFSVNFLLSNEF
ncbi:hypothetical protein HELRODRAFT_193467 [Helobdella robusta]|uniref:Transcription factor IIIB 90 kDa subunit n=1 Tax=Helobdella robusta TaxID=6412 RepID=T1FV10_HELRO|nr:hypothetical protein HELRODRAFT_193467 [Helobdella robusta]ESN96004.1 hypothetical protein HELRODRAFT_193467 [Helobdella robusta]